MAAIRGFIAASLDGYIADEDGGIEWLEEYEEFDYEYDAFIAQIRTVVIGRRTYDQVQRLSAWPYEGKHVIIVSHRPVDRPPDLAEVWAGEVGELVKRLRESAAGDVWVIGGASVQHQFLEVGGLDRIQVHVIPLLLGRGIRLWPPSERRYRLGLRSADRLDGGMVRLDYDIRVA